MCIYYMNTYLRLITTSYHFATLLNERSLSKTSLWRCCVILKLFLDAVNGKFLASKEAFDYIYLSLNDDSNNIEFPFCELSRIALILVRTPIAHQHQHDTPYHITVIFSSALMITFCNFFRFLMVAVGCITPSCYQQTGINKFEIPTAKMYKQ